MNRNKAAITPIIVLLLAIVNSCGTQGENNPSDDTRAIKEANRKYIKLHPKGDVSALMESYVDSIVLMPPGEPEVRGYTDVKRSWEKFFREWTVLHADSKLNEVLVLGDWAFGWGHYVEEMKSNNDDVIVTDSGKFSGLWQRQADGSWKIARDMWNSSVSSE